MTAAMHGSLAWLQGLEGEPYQVGEQLRTITELEPIASLYDWSLNYEPGANPWCVVLDLIGWSEEHLGETITRNPSQVLGYYELGIVADTLKAYAENPQMVGAAIEALTRAERGDVSGEINDAEAREEAAL
jgi:hypothetical protein